MKYILSIFGILMVTLAQAQTNPYSWHFGLKADVNFSNISGNGTASGYTTGYQAGVFAERVLDKTWSIQPELLFTQSNTKKGGDFLTYYNTAGNPYASNDIKLAYVSVPVMVKYNVTPAFSILAGPQYSFLIKDAESLLSSGDGKAFKTSEFSVNAGGQFNIGKVAIYGRYNQGISNINNIDNRYAWRSSHIQLGIAIKLQ